ncbi:hypothetical protein JCM10450v2_001777 [Rhodotorula kratochvilovae]
MAPIKLFDLVAKAGANSPFFSPACMRARLSLLTKGIPFEVVEVTYNDLRFVWKDRLGVQKATAPFIERDDGSLLMDSNAIAEWLDEAYPDRPNLFLPEAPLPVDVKSKEYAAAKERYHADDKAFAGLSRPAAAFDLYASRIVKMFDEETAAYWTSDERLGSGTWARISSQTPEDEAKITKNLQAYLKDLSDKTFSDGRLFAASATKPGYDDFHLMGTYRLVRAVSAQLAAEVFETPASGRWAEWLERMHALYPLEDVRSRDPEE